MSCFPPLLFEDIMKQDIPKKPGGIALNGLFDSYLSTITIPSINKDNLESMVDELRTTQSMGKVMISRQLPLIYSEKFLKVVLDTDNTSQDELNYIARHVILTVIPWSVQLERNGKRTDVNIIVSALQKCLNSDQASLAVRCFEYITDAILSIHEFFKMSISVTTWDSFFQYDESTELTMHVLSKTVNMGTPIECRFFSDLLSVISKIAHDFPDRFIDTGSKFLLVMSPMISSLSPIALDFLEKFSQYIDFDIDLVNSLASEMANSLSEKIENFEPIKLSYLEEKEQIEIKHGIPKYEFRSEEEFGVEVMHVNIPVIPDSIQPFRVYPQESQNLAILLKYITSAISGSELLSNQFLNDFAQRMMSDQNPIYFYSKWYALVFIGLRASEKQRLKITGIIADPKVFYNSITIFDQSPDDFDIVNSMRSDAVDLMLSESGPSLEMVFEDFISKPKIFAEICIRLINRNAKLCARIVESKHLLLLILNAAIGIFQLNEINDNILLAKKYIFVLISYLLQDIHTQEKCFCTRQPAVILFSFLCEAKLNDLIINPLSSFLQNAPIEKLSQIPEFLQTTLQKAVEKFPNKTAIMMYTKVYDCISNVVSFKRSVAPVFIDLCQIFGGISKLDNSIESKHLISTLLSFFSHMGSFYPFNDVMVESIADAIEKNKDNSFLESIDFNMRQLLAGEYLSSPSCTFEIKALSVPYLFLRVYDHTIFIDSVLQMFKSLCLYSFSNIEVLGSSEFPTYIVEALQKAKELEDISDTTIALYLELFSMVSVSNVSPKTVTNFVSLLSPNKNNKICRYKEQFLMCLNNMVNKATSDHIRFYPLNDRTKIYAPTTADFSKISPEGITFTCWLHLGNLHVEYRPNIFNFRANDVNYGAFISGKYIVVYCQTPTMNSSSRINQTLVANQWQFISITLKRILNRYAVNVTIDCSECDPTMLPQYEFDPPYSLSIGGGVSDAIKSPARLTSPALFSYTLNSEAIRIQQMGLNPDYSEIPKLIYHFNTEENSIEYLPHFMKILISKSEIQVLLPLFSHILINGKQFIEFDTVMNILSNILTFSTEAQQSFIAVHGFDILAHLILSQWKTNFTFKMYNKIAQLMNIKNQKIQSNLFKSILGNFELISKLDQSTQKKILNANQTIFASFKEIAAKFCSISELLRVLRGFYWYEKTEQAIVHERADIDPTDCRKIIFKMILMYASSGITSEEFIEICTHALGCPDTKQSLELLDLAVEIAQSRLCDFDYEQNDILACIYGILQSPRIELNSYAIKLLSYLGEMKPESVSGQIKIFITLYTRDTKHDKVLEVVLTEMNHQPAMFALACNLALKIGPSAIPLIIKNIKPDVNYGDIPMWPMMLTNIASPEERIPILGAVLKDKERWIELYTSIDVMFGRYTPSSYDMKAIFLETIMKLMINKQVMATRSNIECYYNLVRNYLFYHPKQNSVYRPMSKLFEETYRYIEKQEKISTKTPVIFSLRFDKDGNWMDQETALQAIQFFFEFNCINHIEEIFWFCGYLQRSSKKSILQYLVNLSLTEKERTELTNSIEFFTYHSFVAKKRLFYGPNFIPKDINFINRFYSNVSMSLASEKYQTLVNQMQYESNICMNSISEAQSCDINNLVRHCDDDTILFMNYYLVNIDRDHSFWESLWSSLSSEGGPWESSVNQQQETERISDYCYADVPVRFVRKRQHGQGSINTSKKNIILDLPVILLAYDEHRAAHIEVDNTAILVRQLTASDISIPLSSLRSMYVIRRSNGKPRGVQFIRMDGVSVSIDTQNYDPYKIATIVGGLMPSRAHHLQFSGLKELIILEEISTKWEEGRITNYEYLMILNHASGRSFETFNNYPIMPSYHDLSIALDRPNRSDIKALLSKESTKEMFDGKEYTPEFFSIPELFEGGIEFVYRNRCWLESDEVSSQLHLWIDKVYPEIAPQSPKQTERKEQFEFFMRIETPTVLSAYSSGRTFSLLMIDGVIKTFEIDPNNTTEFSLEIHEQLTKPITLPKMVIPSSLTEFTYIRTQSPYVVFVNPVGAKNENDIEALCAASNGPWTVIGTATSEIYALYNQRRHFSLNIFRDAIVCADVSEEYGAIAVGTRDESLLLINLATHSVEFSRSARGVPRKVLITPAWGFIVCLSSRTTAESVEHQITVYSINGSFIKIDRVSEIDCWTSFTCDGKDFIVVASTGSVIVFEIIGGKSQEVISDISGCIHLSYSPEDRAIAAVTSGGGIYYSSL